MDASTIESTDTGCRERLAASIRRLLAEPGRALVARTVACSAQLDSLARGLERDDVELEPWAAAACVRLLGDGPDSPLYNPALPGAEARSCLSRISLGVHLRAAVNP